MKTVKLSAKEQKSMQARDLAGPRGPSTQHGDSHSLGVAVEMPPLDSVRLDKAMTEAERAEMIRKRNAVYSKRKYYKKKTNIARLVEQRHQFEAKNKELQTEHRRLLNLLNDCQQKARVIEAYDSARISSLSAAAYRSPAALALQRERELALANHGGGLLRQYYHPSTGMADPPLLTSHQLGRTHQYSELQASIDASRRGYAERELAQNADETALLLSLMQRNQQGL